MLAVSGKENAETILSSKIINKDIALLCNWEKSYFCGNKYYAAWRQV